MKNNGDIRTYFLYGGKWENVRTVFLMDRFQYALVRVTFYDGEIKRIFETIIPGMDIVRLDQEFRKVEKCRDCEIMKVEVIEKSNDRKELEEMKTNGEKKKRS